MSPPSDVAAVDAVIAHHSRSFALASALFPRGHRRDARVVYAYCRRADDLIDEAPPGAAAGSLARLRAELAAIYAGEPTGDVVLDAFAELARRRGIPRAYPEALLDGMAMDVEGIHYATLADLLRYSYRVASTVGLMMCHVMGVRRDAALLPAVRLGLAMQLTNVCRDVAEDWERGRVYLPEEMLADAGAPPLLAAAGGPWPAEANSPVATVIRGLLDLADALYAEADRGLRDLAPRSRLAVQAARLIYAEIGAAVRRQGCDPSRGRAFVSRPRKLWLVFRAALATLGATLVRRGPVRAPAVTFPASSELLPASVAATGRPSGAGAPRAASVVLALALSAAAAPSAGAADPTPPSAPATTPSSAQVGTVFVELYGFESDAGKAEIALFTSATGFPSDPHRAFAHATAKIVRGRARAVLSDVPAGELAVSAFHDENGNGKLDTGLFGAPTEDYGASRDARNAFSAPDWVDAVVRLAPGQVITLSIRIH